MPVGSLELTVGGRALRVLLADLQEHLSPARLADHLYTRKGHDLTVADALVVRPPVDHPIHEIGPLVEQYDPIFRRVAKLPVYVLASTDFAHTLSANIHPKTDDVFSQGERALLVPALRQKELGNIVRRTKAIMQADGATIFRTPSKSYCYRFLRTGNVQIDRSILDTFFFWMLPWLSGVHAIIAESWTISSIVLNATRLLARYAPNQGRCKVELLGDYYDGSAEAELLAEIALERVMQDTTGIALVVFSACMTGNAVSRLETVINRYCHSGLSSRSGSLYNLRPDLPVQCLCELYREVPGEVFKHYKALPVEAEEVIVIDIDKTTYFPSVLKQNEIGVTLNATKPALPFFKDYGLADIFSLHRNSYLADQKVRHHAIYTDVTRLLAQDRFRGRLAEKLAAVDLPALIITPPHESGRAMAKLASFILKENRGHAVRVWEHLDLVFSGDCEPGDVELRRILEAMDANAAILVIDDVSVTGRRLSRYSKSLRDLFKGRIHYLVGLARPEHPESWKLRMRDLAFREGPVPKHTLDYVEFLLLPDWDESSCPWCAEQTLYRNLSLDKGTLPGMLARRNAALSQTQTDMTGVSSPFLGHPIETEFQIGENSIFAPVGSPPATVFAAVASAIQQLRARTDPAHNLSIQVYPQINCIKHTDYLGNTFTDPVLRASFLRAAHRPELERISGREETKRRQATKSIILHPAPGEHCVAVEFILAMALHKLPRVSFTEEERNAPHMIALAELIEAMNIESN